MMTWGDAMRAGEEQLASSGLPSPHADVRLLAEHVWGSIPFPQDLITPEYAREFAATITRRASFEPVQHIMGKMWFRYLELASRPGVFIVRPETEMVAQAGLDALEKMTVEHPVVVDLCTGSGAIAIAIATEKPRTRVWAVERDETAYALANANNERYGNRVKIVHGDARTGLAHLESAVDLLITNPPYVPRTQELPADVHRDPDLALYGGGDDGLDVPRTLVHRAHTLLRPGGVFVMEHGDEQGAALVAEAFETGFTHAYTGRDLTGRDRWLYAEKPEKEG